MESSKEYNSSQTNAISCYSNLGNYGTSYLIGGGIVPPTPATVNPVLFNILRPHKIPQLDFKSSKFIPNCNQYKSISSNCSNKSYHVGQFRAGFNDITR
jgi:hypothetical protein